MKTLRLFPILLLPVLSACSPVACECDSPAPRAAEPAVAGAHPVKGIVIDLLPDETALLVKHEAVPGVMRAMTMMFKVEPDVLTQVKEGDAIEARMSRREDGWWLTGVKVINPTK